MLKTLRRKLLYCDYFSRNIHLSYISFNRTISHQHFLKDDNISSIQEKTLFEEIFTQIMKKENTDVTKNSHNIDIDHDQNHTTHISGKGTGVQVLFEKKRSSTEERNRFLKMVESFDCGTSRQDIDESIRMTTEDIRNYPVSLTPTIFSECDMPSIETPYNFPNLNSLTSKDIKTHLKNVNFDLKINSNILSQMESKQKFSLALNKSLKPYLDFLRKNIETDVDLMNQLKNILQIYQTTDVNLKKQNKQLLKSIELSCQQNPQILPYPYSMTIPSVIGYLFSNEIFPFSKHRKYILLSMIYNHCKKSKDLSLYLHVCNVDFYNLLLKSSWENFHEVHQLNTLVSEMSINGITGDLHTIEILNEVLENMKYLTDSILDSDTSDDTHTSSILWCKENSDDINKLDRYVERLKRILV